MEEQNVQTRDFQAEVAELYAQRPELKDSLLPDEVAQDCVRGKPLKDAYADYEGRRNARQLRQENRILRQNAAAAAMAPVRGVTGGGSPAGEPEDPFLKGFDTAW